ncbi:MAG: DMT family transporter [Paludibacteraceae bacterium]
MLTNKLKGYLLAAVAEITYGMNPLFTLPLYDAGMDANSVLFFRYLFALPILALMLTLRGHSFRMVKEVRSIGRTTKVDWRALLTLAIFGVLFALSSLTLYLSYNYMDAGIASTLLFVYPLMVALLMWICFHERITLLTVLCIATALAGIGLLYKGSDGSTLSSVGTLLVMGSALSYAIYLVGVDHGRMKTIPTLKVTFYVLLFGWMVFAVSALCNGKGISVPPADRWYLWGNLLALGLLPTAISLLCTTKAISYIGPTPVAILGALEPATAIFFGITVFHEQLTLRDCFGLLLIILAVTLVVAGGSLTKPLTRIRKLFPRRKQ